MDAASKSISNCGDAPLKSGGREDDVVCGGDAEPGATVYMDSECGRLIMT